MQRGLLVDGCTDMIFEHSTWRFAYVLDISLALTDEATSMAKEVGFTGHQIYASI